VAAGCGGQGVVAPTPVTVVGTVKQAAPVAKGDPAAGKTLFASNGCSGCHTYKPAGATGKVGPDLDNLTADAQKANQGPLDQYTATSIKSPDSYVVPGFQAGVMPSFSSLSDQQVADLVAFLTQKS
jgi:cytochrome c1